MFVYHLDGFYNQDKVACILWSIPNNGRNLLFGVCILMVISADFPLPLLTPSLLLKSAVPKLLKEVTTFELALPSSHSMPILTITIQWLVAA